MEEVKLPSSEPSQNRPQSILRAVPQRGRVSRFLPYIIVIILISAGIFSGLVLSSRSKSAKQNAQTIQSEDLSEEVKQSFNQTFRDQAEGVIQKNDLQKVAQGTHKLIRPGGESQTAYLTSSVLDLDVYVGKKVKVFGETFSSSEVGWLMDVGKVEELK